MLFPGFKGIKPVRGWLWSVFILSATVQVLGLVGFLDGFTDADGKLDLALFDAAPAPVIYGAVLWGSWAATMLFLWRSGETRHRRAWASFYLSTPVALCLLYLVMAA